MRKVTGVVAAVAAFLLSVLPAMAFDIGLSPAKVEEQVAAGTEKTITYNVMNGSEVQPIRIQVLVYDWALDEHGNMLTPKPGSYPYSASDWVDVSPSEFVIKPKQTQLVRATFKVPAGTKSGDYLTTLIFRQRVVVPPVKARVTGQLIPEGLVGSLAYINVPPGEKKPTLESMKFVPSEGQSPAQVQWVIKNDGNTHIRPSGNIVVTDEAGKTLISKGLTDMSVILRNSTGTRTFAVETLPPGKYKATVNLDLDPETYKYEKGTLDFVVPPKKETAKAAPETPKVQTVGAKTAPAAAAVTSHPASPAKAAPPKSAAAKPAVKHKK